MEEQTIISPAPAVTDADRTQIAIAPGADVTQAALVIQCPVCHTANPPGDRWCQDCGFLLTSPAPEALEEVPAVTGPRLAMDGREFELRPGPNRIGRVGTDVLLPDPTVSRHHATLTIEGESAWIEDVGSTNGSFLNGQPLSAGSRAQVQDGDTLKLGTVTVKLVWPEGGRREGDDTGTLEGAPVEAAPSVAALIAADGRESALRTGVTTLGRRAENTVVLSGDAYVSGRHAEVRCDAGGCVLVDVGSTNGSFLRRGAAGDWERLRPHDPQLLADGDELKLGQTTFTFRAAEQALEEGASADEVMSDAQPTEEPAAVQADEPSPASTREGEP